MNRQVKRYAIISDDWDYVESPSGGFIDHDDYATLEAENEWLRAIISRMRSAERDAARYRWLRDGCDEKYSRATHIAVNCYGMEWDAAIDTAMKGDHQ